MRLLASVVVIAAFAVPARADVELQNDSFVSGTQAAFESGFIANEIGAARFIAPEAGRQLLKVHLIFGPDAVNRTVTVKTYDDSAGTDAPGAELDSEDFQLTGSISAMQEIDISATNVIVPQQFRVGILFQQAGAPQIARDADGNTHPDRNFIFAIPGGWIKSSAIPIQGDWIIRAVISGTGSGGPGPDAGGGGEACTGNPDCPIGEYCDLSAHACTFDCRMSADCNDGTCNSLGMCIANNGGGGGGCCQTGDDGRAPAVIALVVIVALRKRGRRSPA